MPATRKYPKQVQEELQRINTAVGTTDMIISDSMKVLVAALRSLGFAATHAAAGSLERPRNMGPWVDIESPASVAFGRIHGAAPHLAGSERPERLTIEEGERQNLLARARFLPLLEEFYSNRTTPISTRLIVRELAQGWSRVQCQGAQVARLPEYHEEFPTWLRHAQEEMDDFAEFLCGKVR